MIHGILSGLLWGLDTALIGLLLSFFVSDTRWILAAPLLSTFLHDTLSALCFWINTLRKKRLLLCLHWPRTRGGKFLLLASLLGGPLGMTGYVFAIQTMGAGLTAVISAFYPAVGAALAALFLKQKMSHLQWLALSISIGAIIFLSFPGNSGGDNSLHVSIKGLFWAFLCVFCWGSESVLSYYAMTKTEIPEEDAMFWRQNVSVFIYAVAILPFFGAWSSGANFISESAIGIIIPAGILGALSYLQYYKAIHKLGAGPGMALNITYSAWAMAFNIIIFRTLPSVWQLLAGLVVVLASLVAAGALSWPKR